MNRKLALKVADAVLYEGYMLYPYRPSALKNRQRWTFGILYPPDYPEVRSGTERCIMRSECLLKIKGNGKVKVELRFLHLVCPEATQNIEKDADGSIFAPTVVSNTQSWDEAIARSVRCETELNDDPCQRYEFSFPPSVDSGAPLKQAQTSENITSREHRIDGAVTIRKEAIEKDLLKLTIEVTNETMSPSGEVERNYSLLRALLSAHLILTVNGGEFVSLLDPPEDIRAHANACSNIGNFPVLLGVQGEHDMMLCSPIILYDYPQVAPESAGDFYDATEVDEMLTLRVMTLTDREKDEMRIGDSQVRALLERTEQSAREQLMKTHGIIRSLRSGE